MKVQIISDLHLEFLSPKQTDVILSSLQSDADVIILAGDIGYIGSKNYIYFISSISQTYKKVFLITGNHEYYNRKKDKLELDTLLTEFCSQFTNVSLLNNSSEIYRGYKWIGATLWSHVSDPCYTINDMKYIKNMSIDSYNYLHKTAKEYLVDTLSNTKDACIIITHHVPSSQLIHEKYKDDPYNQWFASNMESFFQEYNDKIKLWVYGHTHIPSEQTIGNILFICNPVGYEDEIFERNYKKIIDLTSRDE